MKLNKKHLISAISLGLGVIMLTGFSACKVERNELDYMVNGEENSVVNEFYYSDRQDVESVSEVKMVLKYVDVDLNDDGLDDKFVIIRSPIHSGSHGDTFEILLNDNGNYEPVFNGVFRLYSQEWESVGTVTVLNETNNGLKNIMIKSSEEPIVIQFNGNSYQ